MNILNAQQVKEWDAHTILHEPVASIDLMERAASRCAAWIREQQWTHRPFYIICGKGNNGGDGLAIARKLLSENYRLSVYILESGKPGTNDFQVNLQRLHDISFTGIHFIQQKENFPVINGDAIIVDALFGSGLSHPPAALAAELIRHINAQKTMVVCIDLPSGLFMDTTSTHNTVVEGSHTLTFQSYKLALLVQENAPFMGQVHVLDIGLSKDFQSRAVTDKFLVTGNTVREFFRPRSSFAHKGDFGHALLVAGSHGKTGAAVLAARACLHSGVGLLTSCVPKGSYVIMQTAVPESMVITGENENELSAFPIDPDRYDVLGIGPGIGTSANARNMVTELVTKYPRPMVIDADGLNCLSREKILLNRLPERSILTPHPKEFDRLFGDHANDFDRMATARQKSIDLKVILVVKGHHTMTATPEGKLFFNTTGNAGMAKGGSGDVLTGIITALLAQGYAPAQAALMGVYLHGMAGDCAMNALSMESMTASDIIEFLPTAFQQLGKD